MTLQSLLNAALVISIILFIRECCYTIPNTLKMFRSINNLEKAIKSSEHTLPEAIKDTTSYIAKFAQEHKVDPAMVKAKICIDGLYIDPREDVRVQFETFINNEIYKVFSSARRLLFAKLMLRQCESIRKYLYSMNFASN